MAPEPLAAERTYRNIKRDIMAGRYRPGSPFNLQRLADEFGTSITPVRDSIHRLVGERLLAVHPGGGFHLPALSVQELRELYHWHEQLIRLALHGRASGDDFSDLPERPAVPSSDEALVVWTASFFALVAKVSGNREVIQAVTNAAERLSLPRLRETTLIKAVGDELDTLASLARTGRTTAMRGAIREYHRRRLRRVERIAHATRD